MNDKQEKIEKVIGGISATNGRVRPEALRGFDLIIVLDWTPK